MMLDRERSPISWIDVLWLVFLGGLALLPPLFEIHKQLTLLAIGIFQLFEGWLIKRVPRRGAAYSVAIKIVLATLLLDHTGIPTLAAVCEARAALEDVGLYGQVQLIIAGGIRSGADAAKAMALGADAVYMGTAALIALNCNRPLYLEDYEKLGTEPYHCHHCHTGRCPVGITTQDPELMARLPIDEAAERVANFFHAVTAEIQMLARACGKSNVHDLEPEDLRALTLEASMITGVPLVGTRHAFGGGPGWKREETRKS